jgi:hypothetical protein
MPSGPRLDSSDNEPADAVRAPTDFKKDRLCILFSLMMESARPGYRISQSLGALNP